LLRSKETQTELERDGTFRAEAQALKGILAATVDHIYVVGRDGRYRHVSAGGAKVLGFTPEQLIGKHWRDLGLPAEVMQQFDQRRERALASGRVAKQMPLSSFRAMSLSVIAPRPSCAALAPCSMP
jgi:PAS domain-containing protein